MDERVMDRWMALELHTLAQALVSQTRRLVDVASGEVVEAPTKSGVSHRFDLEAARAFSASLSPLLLRRVKVPMTFFIDKDTDDSCYLADEAAAEAARAARIVPPDRERREGKLWLSVALARKAAKDYPTLFQFVFF